MQDDINFERYYMTTCPACNGEGCESCDDYGKLVIPSKIETAVQKNFYDEKKLRDTRWRMLDMYLTWLVIDDAQRDRITRALDWDDTHRAFELRMSADIVECEEELVEVRSRVAMGKEMVTVARTNWRAAKRAASPSVPLRDADAAPTPTKRTKAAGKICWQPRCQKDARVWDERGRGWCRRHAYKRGLLGEPKEEDE